MNIQLTYIHTCTCGLELGGSYQLSNEIDLIYYINWFLGWSDSVAVDHHYWAM